MPCGPRKLAGSVSGQSRSRQRKGLGNPRPPGPCPSEGGIPLHPPLPKRMVERVSGTPPEGVQERRQSRCCERPHEPLRTLGSGVRRELRKPACDRLIVARRLRWL